MTSRSLGHRAPLLWLALPMMAGVGVARYGPAVPLPVQFGLATLGLAVAGYAAWARPAWLLPMVAMVALCAGSVRYTLEYARLVEWDTLPPREAQLTLAVDRVFLNRDPLHASGLARIVGAERHLADLVGRRIYFSLQRPLGGEPPVRSAHIRVIGVITAVPPTAPANTFAGFLANTGIHFRIGRGRLLETTAPPTPYRVFAYRAAVNFGEILSAGVAPKRSELTTIYRAMLLGQKHELSDEHDALFLQSGTMHLFAISGLHIGVIAVGLHALLALCRLPSWGRLLLATGALWLYVEITGASPSAMRAFLMATLLQAAWLFRAPGNAVAALSAAMLVVVLLWPMQVFSASFQMSYGILAALLLLGLPLADWATTRCAPFRALPKVTWRWYHHVSDFSIRKLVGAAAIGAASTLVSTLCGLHYFELFTPAALGANLILIPAAGVVILAGFASLLAGLVGLVGLSSLFNHAAALVLWLMESGIRSLVQVPGAWMSAAFAAPWIGPVSFLALGALLIWGYATRWELARGGWWPPFALLGLVLLGGVAYP